MDLLLALVLAFLFIPYLCIVVVSLILVMVGTFWALDNFFNSRGV